MTPSEMAFLALGLLLGIAAGGAIVIVGRTRPPTHEIRVTVARDAIPRRAATLASEAFGSVSTGPAPGGPGDRRLVDRDEPYEPIEPLDDRTTVRSPVPLVATPPLPWLLTPNPAEATAASAAVALASPASAAAAASVAVDPEPDSVLVALGLARPASADLAPEADSVPDALGGDGAPLLGPVLAGDRRALGRLVDAVAGPDGDQRFGWDLLLTRFVTAVRGLALDLGFVDLPMGNPFWDTFTVDQCRQIVLALASMGRRYDGRGGWVDGVLPTYRDLTRAVADSGLEPLRIRAWPNSGQIAELFRGASIAAGEAVEQWAPTLTPVELKRYLGEVDPELDELWAMWDVVGAALGAPAITEPAVDAA